MPVAKKEKPAEAKPAETKTAVDAKTTPITTPAKTETVNAQKSATPAASKPQ